MVHYALNMFSNLTNKGPAVIVIFGSSILLKNSRIYRSVTHCASDCWHEQGAFKWRGRMFSLMADSKCMCSANQAEN
jgi:hypothetical protein